MKFKENIIYVVVFTFVITFLFIFILTFVYLSVKDKIKQNNRLFEIRAVLNAMNINYNNDNEAYKIYNKNVDKKSMNHNIIYSAVFNKNKLYAIQFTGKGLWSTITGVIGINNDFTKILGIDFITQNETPGLGGRISEKWFKDQFKNEKLDNFKIIFNYPGGSGDYDKNNNEIDAISGATVTSKSLDKMLNNYLSNFKDIIKKD
jgi:Na+-transporting NADH:ubiquinone oxidoreductase subunit C